MFIHVDKVTGNLVGTSEKNNVSYDNAFSVELSDIDFFANWWDYKYIDDKLINDESDRPEQVKKKKIEAGVRIERNQKLAKTDWVVIKYKELGKAVPAAWKTYRQALRDIPEQEGFPHDVTFPEEPTES